MYVEAIVVQLAECICKKRKGNGIHDSRAFLQWTSEPFDGAMLHP
jgi:hypothetical protein